MGSVAVVSLASAYQHMSYPVRRMETEDRFHKPRAFVNIPSYWWEAMLQVVSVSDLPHDPTA
jgi:hypothetical protein